LYSIGAVERMVGVPAATLRSWEARYGLIAPDRTPGGHRLYSRLQVDDLRFVVDRVGEGVSPTDAHRMLEGRRATGAGDRPAEVARGAVVLVAERDRFAAELTEYFLRTEGYETTVAMSADEVEAVFDRQRPRVVLVDLLLEGVKGLELCRRLSAEPGTHVVAVSVLDQREEALAEGASAFLSKPIRPLELVSTVRDLLGDSAFLVRGRR
jgi:CheY-like chemotaxis protein